VEEEPVEPKKPESKMRYVDMIFEVKDAEVPLFANAGDADPTASSLAIGSKGKATFEVNMNDEKWYQVKSKEKSGWVKGSMIRIYDLAPSGEPSVAETKPAPVEAKDREEATYFEPAGEGVVARAKPDDKSKQVATLEEGKPYRATKSEKIGPDRWFLLDLPNGGKGWAQGIDLQLAEVSPATLPEQPMSAAPAKSAFVAEWIVAGVDGVLVYDRASIAGKVIQRISPPTIYQVTDTSAGGGSEWYKVKLTEKKDGWVQTMDVNLTKQPQ
jgi:hypothetical protein